MMEIRKMSVTPGENTITTINFNFNAKHLRHILQCVARDEHNIIMQGGRRSGKTWSILQYLVLMSIRTPIRVLIVTDTFARLRNSVIQDLERINSDAGGLYSITGGSVPRVRFANGSAWDFVCADRNTKGYSSSFSYIFFNEAIQYDWQVARDLYKAAGQGCRMFYDYNPYARFWVNERIENATNKLITTYHDNPFLSDFVRQHMQEQEEAGKTAVAGTMERYLYEVECQGIDSSLSGRVFPRVEIISAEEWEACEGDIYAGMDWGYTGKQGDPDAVGVFKVREDERKIYCLELAYSNAISDLDLASILSDFDGNHHQARPIACAYDYATNGTERIRSIIGAGGPRTWRYTTARKMHISADLRNLAGYTLAIEKNSINMRKEAELYVWTDGGGWLEPIDRYNHLLDAMRYAFNQYRAEHPRLI